MTSSDKDLDQSLLLAMFLRQMGFFVDIKVPLEVPTYIEAFRRAPSSDVDVIGLRFDPDFQRHLAAGECKSGEHAALEELLKLQGIGTYLEASKAFLIKEKIHANAREMGRKLDVATLTTDELQKLLASVGVDPSNLSEERDLYSKLEKFNTNVPKNWQGLAKYQRIDFWSRPYHENINNLIHLMRQASAEDGFNDSTESTMMVLRTGAYLCLATLDMCRDIVTSGIELPRAVQIFLLGGPQLRRQRERLLDEIRKTVPRSKSIPKTVDPDFYPGIVDLSGYLLLTPQHAIAVPHLFQELQRRTLTGLDFDGLGYSDETRKLMKDVCQLLLQTIGVEKPASRLTSVFAL